MVLGLAEAGLLPLAASIQSVFFDVGLDELRSVIKALPMFGAVIGTRLVPMYGSSMAFLQNGALRLIGRGQQAGEWELVMTSHCQSKQGVRHLPLPPAPHCLPALCTPPTCSTLPPSPLHPSHLPHPASQPSAFLPPTILPQSPPRLLTLNVVGYWKPLPYPRTPSGSLFPYQAHPQV